MSIKLVAFDFDGTLVHTAPDIINATNEFLQLHGRERLSDHEVMIHIGNGLVGLIRGVVPEAEHHPQIAEAIETQFSKVYDAYVLQQAQPFDGVREFLDAWPHKVAIVSNKPERYIHMLLKHLKMDHYPWSAVIGGDTYPEKKPHPLPLQNAMKAAGVSAEETLMVGDGPPDIEVALACKTHLLGVTFGYSPEAELRSLGAKHFVGSFLELPLAIKGLERYN
ncbi:MAG: HAD family hydrolase [Bdellovibrionales bacterium]